MSKSIINAPLGRLNKLIIYSYGNPILKPLQLIIKFLLHLELPSNVHKNKLRLGHPFNIIVNSKCRIGDNVTIYQNVTLGSQRWGLKSGVPTIGHNVIIFPGAIIIGNIKIGNNAIIGAGSVVIADVEPFTIVAGNPAKFLKKIN